LLKLQEIEKSETEDFILKKYNKIIGVAGGISEEEIEKWSSLGLDMYYMGSDWGFIYDRGKENLQRMKNFTKGELKWK
jgi:pentose-5-phosphate-3-epimerase